MSSAVSHLRSLSSVHGQGMGFVVDEEAVGQIFIEHYDSPTSYSLICSVFITRPFKRFYMISTLRAPLNNFVFSQFHQEYDDDDG
jgi:hypothetical protein